MVWRIGNDESIHIKEDKWLPSQLSRSIVSPAPQLSPDAKVSELIDQDIAVWKTDMVKHMFLPHKALEILGIPLSERLPPDRIIWACTPLGTFTTSSVYKLIISCGSASNVGPSKPEAQRQFWKGIWHLWTPNKIKHFVWKACNTALPTMANLHQRHIITTDICEGCQERSEDTLPLWFCKEIAYVWKSMEWFHQDSSVQPVSFSDLVSRFMHSLVEFRMELFSIMAWMLWNRRNARHFGRQVSPLSKICSMASTLLQYFLAIQSEIPTTSVPTFMQQWRPPKQDFYKVNFDAATLSSTNSAGIGVIVRDCDGEVIGALSMPISLPQSVAAVEALACHRAVKFAAEIGLSRVVIEGDSAVIINAFTKDNRDLTSHGNIIVDICALVSGFQLVEFNHVPRACNSVADALVKKASTVTSLQVWLEDTPHDISSLVLRDANVVRDVH